MERSTRNDLTITIVAMAAATTMIAQQIAGKAARDAFFLTHFDVTRLPLMMMVAAGFSLAMVLLMSRLLARYGPARIIPLVFCISAGFLLVLWQLIGFRPRIASPLLYVQVSAVNSVLISGFWSVINERFDPYSAKKVIARLAAAATFGGLLGGVLAKLVSTLADANAILLMLALMHVLCGAAVAVIGRGGRTAPAKVALLENPLVPLRKSSLIRRMAMLALLVATTAAVLDYILKAQAAAALDPDELISFFSYFYVGVGLLSFLLQSAVGNRALRWLGLGGTMLVWPLAVMTTGIGAIVVRSLATATIMRASASVFYNSFFRTGFELLYTPIPTAYKRTGKVMIDVGAERSGDMLGSLIVIGILLLPMFSETLLLLTALGLAALCTIVIMVLHRNYVSQLADNLRSGTVSEPIETSPGSMASESLAPANSSIDRAALLREIERRRAEATANPGTHAGERGAGADPVLDSVMALRGTDTGRIRRVLMSRSLTPELVPHAIALLARDDIVADVLQALRTVAGNSAGQMVDTLLDPLHPEKIRRRLPVVLAYSDSPLAIVGMTRALRDVSWNVRFRAARGLQMLKRRNRHADIAENALLAAVETELDNLARRRAGAGEAAAKTAQRLEMIFLLLGAMDDPSTIELCWHAMHTDDMRLKGTALEYLENRLPPELWERLQPVLNAESVKYSARPRTVSEAAGELHAAADTLRSKAVPTPVDALANTLAEGDNADLSRRTGQSFES